MKRVLAIMIASVLFFWAQPSASQVGLADMFPSCAHGDRLFLPTRFQHGTGNS